MIHGETTQEQDGQNIWIYEEQCRKHVERENKDLDLNSKAHSSAAAFMQNILVDIYLYYSTISLCLCFVLLLTLKHL